MKKNLLDDIADDIPAIERALKLQKKAANIGFDWENSKDIIKKIEEELAEIQDALNNKLSSDNLSEELGDLIFCCINLARHYQVNPEVALNKTNNKFIKRFNYIEHSLRKRNKLILDISLEEMDRLWEEAKKDTI